MRPQLRRGLPCRLWAFLFFVVSGDRVATNPLEMEISFEVRSQNRAIRRVSLVLERLADEFPQDTERHIQKYRSSLSENEQRAVRVWYVNDVQVLRRYLLDTLQAIVDSTNHQECEIVVTKDPQRLLALKNCYCEHCGRLFLQHYGPIAGIVKKCRSCGKLTTCCHQKGAFK